MTLLYGDCLVMRKKTGVGCRVSFMSYSLLDVNLVTAGIFRRRIGGGSIFERAAYVNIKRSTEGEAPCLNVPTAALAPSNATPL
jgi:hypothetical protein